MIQKAIGQLNQPQEFQEGTMAEDWIGIQYKEVDFFLQNSAIDQLLTICIQR